MLIEVGYPPVSYPGIFTGFSRKFTREFYHENMWEIIHTHANSRDIFRTAIKLGGYTGQKIISYLEFLWWRKVFQGIMINKNMS